MFKRFVESVLTIKGDMGHKQFENPRFLKLADFIMIMIKFIWT